MSIGHFPKGARVHLGLGPYACCQLQPYAQIRQLWNNVIRERNALYEVCTGTACGSGPVADVRQNMPIGVDPAEYPVRIYPRRVRPVGGTQPRTFAGLEDEHQACLQFAKEYYGRKRLRTIRGLEHSNSCKSATFFLSLLDISSLYILCLTH